VWCRVAILSGEHGKESVQNILQKLDQLLATSAHNPTQNIRNPKHEAIFRTSCSNLTSFDPEYQGS
jgi:hypothetical protein